MTPDKAKTVLDALEAGRIAHRILEAPSHERVTNEAIVIMREEVEQTEPTPSLIAWVNDVQEEKDEWDVGYEAARAAVKFLLEIGEYPASTGSTP